MFKWLKSIFAKLFKSKKQVSLGLYGAPNVGKTSLANKIAMDLSGKPMGMVSMVPHETRNIQKKEKVELKIKGYKLTMNLLDMPGIAIKVDYRDFLPYGMEVDEAKNRAREATKGIIEAIKWLEHVDTALMVVDSTRDATEQVNITLLGNLEARGINTIIVANKIDLKQSDVAQYKNIYEKYPVIPVSALKGSNMNNLYNEIVEQVKIKN